MGACSEQAWLDASAAEDLALPLVEIGLPAPSALPVLGGHAAPGATGLPGAEYRADIFARNVEAVGTSACFHPQWALTTPAAERHVAAALYLLDGSGGAGPEDLTLEWQTAPVADELWVGLADWSADRWAWRRLADVSRLPIPTGGAFARPGDGAIASVVVVLGTGSGVLERIRGDEHEPPALRNLGAVAAINLETLTDYNQALVFTDAFKTSREWIPQLVGSGGPWDTGAPIDTDADGWVASLLPGQAVMTVMLTDQEGVAPTGRYTCLYEGDGGSGSGTFVIGGNGAFVPRSFSPGRFQIDVNASTNMLLFKIERINPSDPLRNIRVLMPGCEASHAAGEIFHPEFLASLAAFKVLRFMDWGRTNNSAVARWLERSPPGSCRTTTDRGAPIETMVALCNRLEADLWYCVPHRADDDYVRNAVRLIRDTLDPRLRLHLEYSNEVWNWSFAQAGWAHEQGLLLWPGDSIAWLHYYGLRTAQVMDLAAAEFAAQPGGRLVRILATQSANPWAGVQSLHQIVRGPRDFAFLHVDALAIAPYYGHALGLPENESVTQAMSVDDVLDALELESELVNGPGGTTSDHLRIAEQRGLSLISYEGGQHLVGVGAVVDNPIITALFVDANRHPRMRQIYADDLARWTARGGGLFTIFTHTGTPGKWGSWGILESQTQDRAGAPKWLGVHDWLASFLR